MATKQEQLNEIRKVSARSLPDNPSEAGFKPEQIKQAMYLDTEKEFEYRWDYQTANDNAVGLIQDAVTALTTEINNIKNGTTVAEKANKDGDGNVIKTTYAKIDELISGATAILKYLKRNGQTEYVYTIEESITALQTVYNTFIATCFTNNKANSAITSDRAIGDSNGNNISTTYATLSALNGCLSSITNILNGDSVVGKARKDANGDVIDTTYLKSSGANSVERVSNKTTIVNSGSTDTQYPSAKAVYTICELIRAVAEGKTKAFSVDPTATGNSAFQSDNATITATSFVDIEGTTVTVSELHKGDLVWTINSVSNNYKDRWLIDSANGSWGIIDADSPDMSNYYTKTETDALLGAKQPTLTSGDAIDITNNTIGVKYDNSTIKKDGNNKLYTDFSNVNENIADAYDSSATYSAGDYAIHNGVLKQYDGTNWTTVNVTDNLDPLPTDPTTDGTYYLKDTVSSGSANRSWEENGIVVIRRNITDFIPNYNEIQLNKTKVVLIIDTTNTNKSMLLLRTSQYATTRTHYIYCNEAYRYFAYYDTEGGLYNILGSRDRDDLNLSVGYINNIPVSSLSRQKLYLLTLTASSTTYTSTETVTKSSHLHIIIDNTVVGIDVEPYSSQIFYGSGQVFINGTFYMVVAYLDSSNHVVIDLSRLPAVATVTAYHFD